MIRLVDAAQMKELDGMTIHQIGIPSLVLMERAALSAALRIRQYLEKTLPPECRKHAGFPENRKVLFLCGSGNNGGDGIAAARILTGWGIAAVILLAGDELKMTPETKAQLLAARHSRVREVKEFESGEYAVIADALFGVGLSRPVGGYYRELIEKANRCSAWKIAIDIPSGVDASSGQELGTAFQADETVTFAFGKAGLYLYPGKALAGSLSIADIGIYENPDLPGNCFLVQREDLAWLHSRISSGNKGTFGKALVVAGSKGMCGAAYFCAKAALETGIGMVKIQTDAENRIPLLQLLPEAILDVSDDPEAWQKDLDWCDCLVIGPGLGMDESAAGRAKWFMKHAVSAGKPVVVDADGLNLLADHPEWREWFFGQQEAPVILTPHLGEMSRLSGLSPVELAADRIRHARDYASRTGTILVMKDACTVTADPEGMVYLSPAGNSGMATAGSGDVLAGILGGICARSRDLAGQQNAFPPKNPRGELVQRTASGVLLHGMAGDLAAGEKGPNAMTAGDILDCLWKIQRTEDKRSKG